MRSILSLLICLLLVACGGSERTQARREWMQSSDRLKVLSTTAMIDSLAKEIAGEHADTLVLIGGELDPHSYEPVKGDQELFARADLIFYNGLGLEHGPSLEKFLVGSPKAVSVGAAIEEKIPQRILHLDGVKDPHIWMDLSLFAEGCEPMAEALAEKLPSQADYFRQRASQLKSQLLAAHKQAVMRFQQLPAAKRYLVSSHDAFGYFCYAYLVPEEEKGSSHWRLRCQAPEGLAPEGQLSLADIRLIAQHLKRFDIRVIFPESNVNPSALDKIAEVCKEEGLDVYVVTDPLYGDAMGTDTYQKMIVHNVHVIANQLEKNAP